MFATTLRIRALAAAVFAGSVGMAAATTAKTNETTFKLFPQTTLLGCMKPSANAPTPKVSVTVDRRNLNDTATITLTGFRPHLGFDLFTIQHSPQTATGAADPNPSVGMAWYQSDLNVRADGTGSAKIQTVLLDQIFGVDKDVTLAPTNTFHLGFWFDNPADAAACGFTGTTPFNGEHAAGPLAFVTRPNATTNLGPLCTDPVSAGGGAFTCNG